MNFDWESILYSIPAVIIGLTVHEFMHAYAAYRLGDTTAKDMGRLTLNPLKHIDPLGMLFIILAGFGWAKPVQFVPANLKNPRADKAIIALAGPMSNLAMGILFLFILKAFVTFGYSIPDYTYTVLTTSLVYLSLINLGLFMFNILPIPPLDGSHVFFSGINLSQETEAQFMKYGSYALFAVLFIESRMDVDIIPIGLFTDFVFGLFFK